MRWHYRDAALLWLFPPAYLAHLAEEVWGGEGLSRWLGRIFGQSLPFGSFVAINTVAFVLLILGTAAAVRRESRGWIAIAVATVVTINALLHLAGSVLTRSYSPGLVTGIVFYLPLGQLLLIRALHQVEPARFMRGVLAGVAIHTAVVIAAAASSL